MIQKAEREQQIYRNKSRKQIKTRQEATNINGKRKLATQTSKELAEIYMTINDLETTAHIDNMVEREHTGKCNVAQGTDGMVSLL